MLPFLKSPAERYKDRNPVVVAGKSANEAEQVARANATAKKARIYRILDTGSMYPLIRGGQFVVGEPTPYGELQVGDIINYKPEWNGGKPAIHRIVAKDKGGFLLSGDNNPRTESWMRVTPENYLDRVTTIYDHPESVKDDPTKRAKK